MAGILLEDACFCFAEPFVSQTAPLQISTHLTAAATFIARLGFVQLGQRWGISMLRKMMIFVAALVFTACLSWAQDSQNSQPMPGMDMSGHDMSKMSGHADGKEMSKEDAANAAPV